MRDEEYEKLADVEDRLWYFRALHRRRAHWLARTLPRGEARVLDAGCGTGGFLKSAEVRRRGWQLVGIDFSPVACQLARNRSGVEIEEGSITALPFEDGAFAGITTGDVLYHVEDVAMALREFARCLRPGGVVVLNEPAYRWLWSYHDEAVDSKHRFTRGELVGLLRAAGFEVKYAGYANLPILPLVALRRKVFPPKQTASDVEAMSAPVDAFLGALAWIEHQARRLGLRLPAGTSVLVVGRKRCGDKFAERRW